jgi:hypothetical protein
LESLFFAIFMASIIPGLPLWRILAAILSTFMFCYTYMKRLEAQEKEAKRVLE